MTQDEGGRPFDLVVGALVRTSLVRVTEATHVLLVVLHHIVADGWSLGVLFRELQALYAAETTGEPAGSDAVGPASTQTSPCGSDSI